MYVQVENLCEVCCYWLLPFVTVLSDAGNVVKDPSPALFKGYKHPYQRKPRRAMSIARFNRVSPYSSKQTLTCDADLWFFEAAVTDGNACALSLVCHRVVFGLYTIVTIQIGTILLEVPEPQSVNQLYFASEKHSQTKKGLSKSPKFRKTRHPQVVLVCLQLSCRA